MEDHAHARFLTVAEVAALMRVSTMTVYRLIKAGELASVRVGKSYRVREDDVPDPGGEVEVRRHYFGSLRR